MHTFLPVLSQSIAGKLLEHPATSAESDKNFQSYN